MFAYSINNHEILWSAKENSIYGFSYDPGHSLLGVANFEAISIRNVDTGQEEPPIVNRDFPATQCIGRTDIKFFSDGSKIVTLESSFDTYDSQIYIWDETSEKCLGKLTERKGYAFDLHLSQDNNYLGIALFSGRDDENRVSNYVQIWDLSDEKKICTYENSGPMALSPDGKISASINIVNGNDIEIWDVRSCELIETIVRKPDNRPYSLDIDRKGELLAMGGENTIQIWRIEDQKLLFETENLYNNVSNIRFSPDGKYLLSAIQRLSGNDEGIITLWKIIN
ncbi:hypothetical protein EH221_01255 [bacterium]|nr:MAG: hypothetical protein EH221_01255 [bacterium]